MTTTNTPSTQAVMNAAIAPAEQRMFEHDITDLPAAKIDTMTEVAATGTRVAPGSETMVNDDTVNITDTQLDIGQLYAQGDLYMVRIPSMPASAKPRPDRKLAPGNTQGSRHVLTIGDAFDADTAEVQALLKQATGKDIGPEYIGPVFQTTAQGKAYVAHSEHGDLDFRAAEGGSIKIAVVFQRSLDAENIAHRVAD